MKNLSLSVLVAVILASASGFAKEQSNFATASKISNTNTKVNCPNLSGLNLLNADGALTSHQSSSSTKSGVK